MSKFRLFDEYKNLAKMKFFGGSKDIIYKFARKEQEKEREKEKGKERKRKRRNVRTFV
jgi:hypothetical protein